MSPASWRPRTSRRCFPSTQMIARLREIGFFGVSGMSSGSVLPAVAASGNTSSNEKMSRSFSPESASGRRSVSQDVSSDVRLSMTRNARAWRAGMVTTGAAVNPSEMAGRVNGSAVLRSAPAPPGDPALMFSACRLVSQGRRRPRTEVADPREAH